jgi:hypothetical protein
VKWLALSTNRFAFAGLLLAFPYKARFGRPMKWLALSTNRLADCAMAVPIKHEEIKAIRITRVIAASDLMVNYFSDMNLT